MILFVLFKMTGLKNNASMFELSVLEIGKSFSLSMVQLCLKNQPMKN